jgi:hypothetical protein
VRSTVMYCNEETSHKGEKYFTHFFPSAFCVELCDSGPALQVTVSETTETPDSYWGWWDNEDQAFAHVYVKKFMVEMCFPYPVKLYEERGDGKLLPVEIKIV